jgi:glycosyltransferase involved in cell wall biosynthesis
MISIAMATYNGEEYIREQIDSILQQTYQDFELIICDDCSVDLTWIILKKYKERDKRIFICQNEKNLGFNKNFEKAISLCHGEYIALSDQDDFWYSDHLEILYKNIGENSLICSNSLFVNNKRQSLGQTMYDKKRLINLPKDDKSIAFYILYNNFVQGSTTLFKRELVDMICPFPNDIDFHDHWLALNAIMSKGLIYLNTVTLEYRQHSNNITNNNVKSYKYYFKKIIHSKNKMYPVLLFLKDRHMPCVEWKYNLLNEAIKYYKSREMSFFSIYACFFLLTHYKKLYCQNNYRYLFFRLIKTLL